MPKTTTKGPPTYFRPKATPGISLSLTDLGRGLLDSASSVTGWSRSDLVEALIRRHGIAGIVECAKEISDQESPASDS